MSYAFGLHNKKPAWRRVCGLSLPPRAEDAVGVISRGGSGDSIPFRTVGGNVTRNSHGSSASAVALHRPSPEVQCRRDRRSKRGQWRRARTACASTAGSEAITPTCRTAGSRSCSAPARFASMAARAKASTRLAAGQSVRIPPLPATAPAPAAAPKALSKADRAFLASITLYEDDDLLVLNKPPGSPCRVEPRPRIISTGCSKG